MAFCRDSRGPTAPRIRDADLCPGVANSIYSSPFDFFFYQFLISFCSALQTLPEQQPWQNILEGIQNLVPRGSWWGEC